MSESKETKESKDQKNTLETQSHKLDLALKTMNITKGPYETAFIKELLLDDLEKLKEIEAFFKANPTLTKIARTNDRIGQPRERNKEFTEIEKKLGLNFSVVRSVDEKTGKETICFLMEGRGLKKYRAGKRIDTSGKVGKELGKGGLGLVKFALTANTLEVGAVKISEFLTEDEIKAKERKEQKDEKEQKEKTQVLAKQEARKKMAREDHAFSTKLGRTEGEAVTENKHYSFMRYFPGKDLLSVLNDSPNVIDKLNIAFNAAKSLQNLHDSELIHRDVKLDNFICNLPTREVNIIDFGFTVMGTKQDGILIKKDKKKPGTPGYLDPNLAPDKNSDITFSSSSDIYALGIVYLYLFYYWKEALSEKYTGVITHFVRDLIDKNKGKQNLDQNFQLPDSNKDTNTRTRIEDLLTKMKQEKKGLGDNAKVSPIAELVSSMITRNQKDRPKFDEIYDTLSNSLLAQLRQQIIDTPGYVYERLNTSADFINNPLYNYIAINNPNKIVDLLISLGTLANDSGLKYFHTGLEFDLEEILKNPNLIEFLKKDQRSLEKLLNTYKSTPLNKFFNDQLKSYIIDSTPKPALLHKYQDSKTEEAAPTKIIPPQEKKNEVQIESRTTTVISKPQSSLTHFETKRDQKPEDEVLGDISNLKCIKDGTFFIESTVGSRDNSFTNYALRSKESGSIIEVISTKDGYIVQKEGEPLDETRIPSMKKMNFKELDNSLVEIANKERPKPS